MKEYLIRQLMKEEIPDLIVLCSEHAAYEEAVYASLNQVPDLAAHIFCDDPRVFCWVVQDKHGKLAGYCTYMLEFSTWRAMHFIHMDCLYLRPEARNKKLGQSLMQKMCHHARELEIDEIQWQTPASNTDAIRFYKRIGAFAKMKIRFSLDPLTVPAD